METGRKHGETPPGRPLAASTLAALPLQAGPRVRLRSNQSSLYQFVECFCG